MKCFYINCKKSIPLRCQYSCHCKKIFCTLHKDPDNHFCTFDFKLLYKERLKRENPHVISSKITKI